MNEGLTYQAQGRQPRTAVTLGAVWVVLGLLYLQFDAAPWVIGVIIIFSLPAVWDLVANPSAGMQFDPQGVNWHAGRRDAQIPWGQIDHVRLDTRLDLSVRAAFVLVSGKRLRVPFEATPPHETLEAALTAKGIRVERHHFSLLG